MSDDDVSLWLSGLKRGDARSHEAIWREYFDRLMRLIRNRAGSLPLRERDEEDLALSALHSFCQAAQAGRFPQLDDRQDLWKLLVTIACRKTNAYRDQHYALKRGGGEQRGESVFVGLGDSSTSPGIDGVLGREPTPDLACAVVETVQRLLQALDDPLLQKIAQAKMEGFTNDEIAQSLDCTTRTVERKLELVRRQWTRLGLTPEEPS